MRSRYIIHLYCITWSIRYLCNCTASSILPRSRSYNIGISLFIFIVHIYTLTVPALVRSVDAVAVRPDTDDVAVTLIPSTVFVFVPAAKLGKQLPTTNIPIAVDTVNFFFRLFFILSSPFSVISFFDLIFRLFFFSYHPSLIFIVFRFLYSLIIYQFFFFSQKSIKRYVFVNKRYIYRITSVNF